MKSQVKVLSQTIVKPSSPTPNHLRHLQLSSLDQIIVRVFTPMLVFYPKSTSISNAERCQRARRSLSDILTLFYPWAGRVRGNSHVDCNDEGVPFVEAEAKGTILDVLQNPICNNLNKFLPFSIVEDSELCCFVQFTYFDCGGMAIGVGLSHKIADALSGIRFLKSWAEITRGEISDVTVPKFEAANYFPPIDISDFDPCFEILKDNPDIVSKRFMFDANSTKRIREKYVEYCCNSGNMNKIPTIVEALTAFLCSRFISTTRVKEDNSDTIYTVKHAIDLRTRMDPPLPEQHTGNFIYEPVVAEIHKNSNDNYCCDVISQMRRTLRSVDAEFVKKLQKEAEKHLKMMKDRAEAQRCKKVVALIFSSLNRFPIYEIDFGWGKPEWVGAAAWPYQNMFMFSSAKEKGGIEVQVQLRKEDMAEFEKDDDLSAFVSPKFQSHVKSCSRL